MLPLLPGGVRSHCGDNVVLTAGDYKPGDVLGKYRVLEVIGRGSNGVTYKVWPRRGHACHRQHTRVPS